MTGFASDNEASVHPAVLRAIADADGGHQDAYGDDAVTASLEAIVRRTFGADAAVFPVFNGTGANLVAMRALIAPWQAVICSQDAHLHVHEGGAPEQLAGVKLWTVPAPDGKLTPELVDTQAWGFDDVHRAQPGCVSVTQSTELGTVYTPDELAALTEHARRRGLLVHLDGARLANAAAHLDVPLRAITTEAGIDIVSFGGTKNGGLLAEAVVVLNPALRDRIGHVRKASAQLASKMRYISAQLVALLTDELWLHNARHANAMARRLRDAVHGVVDVVHPVQANAVFATLPTEATARLQDEFRFHVWDPAAGCVRWMCAWDTTPEQVDRFAAAIAAAVSAARSAA